MPCVCTRKFRQRQMLYFMETKFAHRFIAIGRTTPWEDETNPPRPNEDATEIEELIGLQRVAWIKYAKPIPNPTTLQKKLGIYYKGLYYSVTNDTEIALEDGYTSVMLGVVLDRDTIPAIPVGVEFRQIGLYDGVKATSQEIEYGITREQFYNKSPEDRGMLLTIDNRGPILRQKDQAEELIALIDF